MLKTITVIGCSSYGYDVSDRVLSHPLAPFVFTLAQGWLGRSRGTVVDDATLGLPGTGTTAGRLSYPHVEFTKQMPVFVHA